MSGIRDKYLVKSCYIMLERMCGVISDRTFLRLKYVLHFHRLPNLDNPETYNEKLQWLKLNYRPGLYKTLADKYEVRGYVSERIGSKYLIPLIGCWERAEDISFDAFPDQFVLKCNHDSGSAIICRDRNSFDYRKAKKYLKRAVNRNYYLHSREWQYEDVNRCIIAEKLIRGADERPLEEYKFFCFNGRAVFFLKFECKAHKSDRTIDFFDRDCNHIDVKVENPMSNAPQIEKTEALNTMMRLAEELSESMPHVRVDFYYTGEKIYFGEMTFFSWGGFAEFDPPEWDLKFGRHIQLPAPLKG